LNNAKNLFSHLFLKINVLFIFRIGITILTKSQKKQNKIFEKEIKKTPLYKFSKDFKKTKRI
jgi:hypothetical protein